MSSSFVSEENLRLRRLGFRVIDRGEKRVLQQRRSRPGIVNASPNLSLWIDVYNIPASIAVADLLPDAALAARAEPDIRATGARDERIEEAMKRFERAFDEFEAATSVVIQRLRRGESIRSTDFERERLTRERALEARELLVNLERITRPRR
jgi:hypothetical protein